MKFADYTKQKKVIKGTPDPQKAKALLKMYPKSIATAERMGDKDANAIMTMSYSALRQVLEAMALVEGYHVYSHEAFTQYLIEKGEDECAVLFDIFRKRRNGVEYYGKPVSAAVAKTSLAQIKIICTKLVKKYLNELK